MPIQYDTATGLPVEVKQPWEEFVVDMNLSPRINIGDSIASVAEVTFINQGLISGSGDITLGLTAFSGTIAQVQVSGGQDLENYKLSFRCITVAGEKVEGDGILYVRD